MTQFTDGQTVVNAAWLNGVDKAVNQSGTTAGAALISYTPPGTGSVAISVSGFLGALPYSVWNVMSAAQIADSSSFTGSIDLSSVIQQAVNNCNGRLYFPPGSYKFGGVTMTSPIIIEGSGSDEFVGSINTGTRFVPASSTATLFTLNAQGGGVFRDFSVQGLPQTANALFQIEYTSAVSVANAFTLFDNVRIDSCFWGINIISALLWTVRNCTFWNIANTGIGVLVQNTFNSDQGDGNVQGCTFSPLTLGTNSASAVTWSTGGAGLRMINNKSFCGTGLNANLTVSQATGQITVEGNSFDNSNAAINMFILSGTFAFSNITIVANNFESYNANASFISVGGFSTAHISDLLISDNMIEQLGGSITGNGAIQIQGYVDRLTISDNHIYSSLGASSGIFVGTNNTAGQVNDNNIIGFSTEVSSASPGIRVRGRRNAGTQSASAATSVVVTHNLGVTPGKIWATPSGANTGNWWITAASSTQFTINWATSSSPTWAWEVEV